MDIARNHKPYRKQSGSGENLLPALSKAPNCTYLLVCVCLCVRACVCLCVCVCVCVCE